MTADGEGTSGASVTGDNGEWQLWQEVRFLMDESVGHPTRQATEVLAKSERNLERRDARRRRSRVPAVVWKQG